MRRWVAVPSELHRDLHVDAGPGQAGGISPAEAEKVERQVLLRARLDETQRPSSRVGRRLVAIPPDPNDGGRSVPCTSTWVFAVKGGHVNIESDSGDFSEVGKCGARS